MRILLIEQMREIAVENPDLTFGDILYTITRKKYFKRKFETLADITDKEYTTALEKAQKDLKNGK